MKALKLHRLDTGDQPDVFDDFFKDHTIDIQTGELLGRYIAEERDTARLLRRCYDQLKLHVDTDPAPAPVGGVARVEAKVDELRRAGRRAPPDRVRADDADEIVTGQPLIDALRRAQAAPRPI